MKTALKVILGIAAGLAVFRVFQVAVDCILEYVERSYFSVEL